MDTMTPKGRTTDRLAAHAPACRNPGNHSGSSDRRTRLPYSSPAPPVHHLPEADAPVPEGVLPVHNHLKAGSLNLAENRLPDRLIIRHAARERHPGIPRSSATRTAIAAIPRARLYWTDAATSFARSPASNRRCASERSACVERTSQAGESRERWEKAA